MPSIRENMKLELALATILVCGLICGLVEAAQVSGDANNFALSGDDKIDWFERDKFETLEEMLARENIKADDPEEEYQLVESYFNEKLSQVKRSGAEKSPRLANELSAFNAIRYISHPTLEPCDMDVLIVVHEQVAGRPLVGRLMKYLGGRKIEQCREELSRKFTSLQRSLANPTVIERLPADELIKYVTEVEEGARISKASWPILIGLLYTANDDEPQSNVQLKIQCNNFDEKMENYRYATRLANVIKSVAPDHYSEVMHLPNIEALRQRQVLCSDIQYLP